MEIASHEKKLTLNFGRINTAHARAKRDVEKNPMTQQCFFYLIDSGTMGE